MNRKNIIDRLFDRDESVLETIQNEFGALIRSVAFNIFRNDSVAEECLNDTLMDIWNTIPPERPASISSYACMIVRRRAIDRLRRENAHKRARPEGSGYTDVREEISYLDDISAEVTDKVVLAEIISDFLRSQSRINREIFISRYFDFESLDSIAARIGKSKNSVNIRLSRMRDVLGEKLKKGGVEL